MLLRFSVENYMSFKDRVELCMIPGRGTLLGEHIIKAANKNNGIRALKGAFIYGANASGKSNLIRAMHRAQRIIEGNLPSGKSIPYNPFKLDKTCMNKPSRFEFEIKLGRKAIRLIPVGSTDEEGEE